MEDTDQPDMRETHPQISKVISLGSLSLMADDRKGILESVRSPASPSIPSVVSVHPVRDFWLAD